MDNFIDSTLQQNKEKYENSDEDFGFKQLSLDEMLSQVQQKASNFNFDQMDQEISKVASKIPDSGLENFSMASLDSKDSEARMSAMLDSLHKQFGIDERIKEMKSKDIEDIDNSLLSKIELPEIDTDELASHITFDEDEMVNSVRGKLKNNVQTSAFKEVYGNQRNLDQV